MKNNIKKKSTAVVAIIAVAAILLSGTFAYVLNNQHRSDYLSAEDRIYDLTLINNFTQYGEQDWNNNKTVLNPVQIKSSANTDDETYVNAYVAVQLMEYLDVYTRGGWLTVGEVLASSLVGTVGTSFNANNTDQALFAIDDNGDYMTYTAATSQFGADYIVEYNGFAMFNGSQTLVQGTAIYGIHGKPMRDEKTEYTYGNPTPYEHVQESGAENQVNAECDATVIEGWGVETPAVEAREYVSFLLDETNNVMLLSDWMTAYAVDDTDPALTGAFWIIDDVNGTGWAYWAQALAPGEETSNLLESITLEKEISKIDYYMHVDMASASLDEIDVLTGAKTANGCEMPDEMVAMFKTEIPDVMDDKWLEETTDGDKFVVVAYADASGNITGWNGAGRENSEYALIITKDVVKTTPYELFPGGPTRDTLVLHFNEQQDHLSNWWNGVGVDVCPADIKAMSVVPNIPAITDGTDVTKCGISNPTAMPANEAGAGSPIVFSLSATEFYNWAGDTSVHNEIIFLRSIVWTRSEIDASRAWNVLYYSNDTIDPTGNIDLSIFCIRPALWVKIPD